MTSTSLSNQDWHGIVDRLGGAEAIMRLARETKAFLRARGIATAIGCSSGSGSFTMPPVLAGCRPDGYRAVVALAT
jgi:hypothetical protein